MVYILVWHVMTSGNGWCDEMNSRRNYFCFFFLRYVRVIYLPTSYRYCYWSRSDSRFVSYELLLCLLCLHIINIDRRSLSVCYAYNMHILLHAWISFEAPKFSIFGSLPYLRNIKHNKPMFTLSKLLRNLYEKESYFLFPTTVFGPFYWVQFFSSYFIPLFMYIDSFLSQTHLIMYFPFFLLLFLFYDMQLNR